MYNEKFQIYSDETGHGRYQSIGCLSGEVPALGSLREKLKQKLEEIGTGSIEFKKINGHSAHEKAAIKFLCTGVEYALMKRIRIDILTWYLKDSRHNIRQLDEQKNYELMYYKILKWVQQCWSVKTLSWQFYPDQNSAINWQELIKCIENTDLNRKRKYSEELFLIARSLQIPSITDYSESDSKAEPLIQLIDLFTGFTAFSCDKGNDYFVWQASTDKSPTLFANPTAGEIEFTNGEMSKYRCLSAFISKCKMHKMGVSINTKKYLWTPDPKRWINYWMYEPQGEYDKAPKTIGRMEQGSI